MTQDASSAPTVVHYTEVKQVRSSCPVSSLRVYLLREAAGMSSPPTEDLVKQWERSEVIRLLLHDGGNYFSAIGWLNCSLARGRYGGRDGLCSRCGSASFPECLAASPAPPGRRRLQVHFESFSLFLTRQDGVNVTLTYVITSCRTSVPRKTTTQEPKLCHKN